MRNIRNPWSSVQACRSFLRGLVYGETESVESIDFAQLSAQDVHDWVREYELGPLAYHRYRHTWPEMANMLMGDWLSASAENSIRFKALNQAIEALQAQDITPVILKGALLAELVYDASGLRTMSDADLWIEPKDMRKAAKTLQQAGYLPSVNEDRPIALQELVLGEIGFAHPEWEQGALDVHWSPFHGWWYRRATSIDANQAWQRKLAVEVADQTVWRMSSEDLIIHTALHVAMSAQFDSHTIVRSLVDIAHIASKLDLDWAKLAATADRWQVTLPIWTVLRLADTFVGLEGVDVALAELQPSVLRRRAIEHYFSAESILQQRDWTTSFGKLFRFVLLTDRWTGLLRFVFRTVWPEPAWLKARYGQPVSNFYHLKQLAGL